MPISVKNFFTFLAISLAISIVSVTNQGENIEKRFGLPLHYKLRGEIKPPENIFILTPYKNTEIGQTTLLRHSDRMEHAKVIGRLKSLNARQIAVDIYFSEYQTEQNDEELATSLEESKNLILVQILSNIKTEIGWVDLIRNPIKSLAEFSPSLAPALLDNNTHRKDAFYPYYSVVHDKQQDSPCFSYLVDADLPNKALASVGTDTHKPRISTLPAAMLELHLLNSNSFENLKAVLAIKTDQFQKIQLCELMHLLREELLNKPDILKGLVSSESSPALKSWLESLIYLKKHLGVRKDNPGIYLNFYGQPQTIHTMTYQEFNQHYDEFEFKPEESKFNNAAVFIGGLFEVSNEDKSDDFETAVANDNDKMSGVEITATAFANLLNNNYLRKYSKTMLFFMTFLCCISTFSLSIIRKEKLILLGMALVVFLYILIATHYFKTQSYWFPIVTPLIGLLLSSAILLANRFWITQKQKQKFTSYLPSAAVRSVEAREGENTTSEITQGVCMVTDVQGFTQISEQLPVAQMKQLVNEYFSILNQCVSNNNGEVYLVDGDSLTAVWEGQQEYLCNNSAKAALCIMKSIEKFNQLHSKTPFITRIGMDCGEFALGNIGDKSHYTFAVVGDTVYTASRLEQYNKNTQTSILITDNIEKNLKNFKTRDLGQVKLRGKNNLTKVYELVS